MLLLLLTGSGILRGRFSAAGIALAAPAEPQQARSRGCLNSRKVHHCRRERGGPFRKSGAAGIGYIGSRRRRWSLRWGRDGLVGQLVDALRSVEAARLEDSRRNGRKGEQVIQGRCEGAASAGHVHCVGVHAGTIQPGPTIVAEVEG